MVASMLALAMAVAALAIFAFQPASEEPLPVPRVSATDGGGAADDPTRAKPSEVLAGFEPGTSEEARGRAARGVGAQDREVVFRGRGRYPRVELLRLPRGSSNAQAVGRLRQDPAVAYSEPNWIQRPAETSNDTYFTNGSLWGMYGQGTSPDNEHGSQAAKAWAAGHTGAERVYVGVIDEGIQYSHPDLKPNAWNNPSDQPDGVDNDGNGYVDDTRGWDFANNDGSVYDGGHQGPPRQARDSRRRGQLEGHLRLWQVPRPERRTTANAIRAVDYFTDLKARHGLNLLATNNSWGGGGFSQGLLDAINRGGDANILFVAAAGNGGSDGVGDNNDLTASYPSNYQCWTLARTEDCLIAVAALTSSVAPLG